MTHTYNDGGRAAAGFTGKANDCVARALSIAMERPYLEVYNDLAAGNATQRKSKRATRSTGKLTAQERINTKRKWFRDYMEQRGWVWTPTMQVGQGCKVHLDERELPLGRLIVSVSRHYAAVIDGVLHDTFDCARGGRRCVYGYYSKAAS